MNNNINQLGQNIVDNTSSKAKLTDKSQNKQTKTMIKTINKNFNNNRLFSLTYLSNPNLLKIISSLWLRILSLTIIILNLISAAGVMAGIDSSNKFFLTKLVFQQASLQITQSS